jgi:ABC-type transporter Mla subunit MlaD
MEYFLDYLVKSFESTVNIVATCVIGFVFFFGVVWHLGYRVSITGNKFSQAIKKLDGIDKEDSGALYDLKLFHNSPKLKKLWDDFMKEWNNSIPSGKSPIGTVDINDYFSTESVFGNASYFRKLEGYPGRLLSLGILGTFIGLSYGLTSFPDTIDSKEMANAALSLINGLSVAFFTSILGILLSLFFLVLEKWRVGKAVESLTKFCEKSVEYFPVYNPEQVLSRIAVAGEEQAESLMTLGNDLAVTLSESFGTAIQDHLAPLIEEIHKSVSKATDTSIENQTEGIAKLINEVMDGLHEKLGGSFRDLGENIETASDNLNTLTDRLEIASETQLKIMAQTSNTAEVLDKQLPNLLSFADQMKQAGTLLNDAIGATVNLEDALSEGTKQLVQVQKETTNRISALLTQMTESSNLSKTTSESLVESQERMEKTYREALESFEKNIKNGLVQSLTTFDSVLSDVLERFSGTLADLKDQYEALERHSGSLKEGVEAVSDQISSNLSSVGEVSSKAHKQIKELSETYMKNMGKGLISNSEMLTSLNESSTNIASNLGFLQESLSTIVELGNKINDQEKNTQKSWRPKLFGGGK